MTKYERLQRLAHHHRTVASTSPDEQLAREALLNAEAIEAFLNGYNDLVHSSDPPFSKDEVRYAFKYPEHE